MQKNPGGHELTIQDSGAPRGERNHWEVTLNGVVLYSDFNGKKANSLFDAVESALTDMAPKRAQLPSQGGEAVEVVHWGSSKGYQAIPAENKKRNEPALSAYDIPLMTVAQHQRILAAATHPADQVAEGVVVQEMEWLEQWLLLAAEPIGQECCGRAHLECCGNSEPVYRTADEIAAAMNARREELRALLAKSEGVKK